MKKLIAVLLCIVMLISCFSFGTFAAEGGSVSIALSSGSASAYSDVSLTLSLGSNSGFSVMVLDLDHGSENITLKSVDCSVSGVTADFSNWEGGSTIAFYHLESNCTATGALATLTFSVGAFSGDANITVSAEEGNICNSNALALAATFTAGKLTVSCTHTYVYEGRTEPSCSKEGEIRYICTICEAIKSIPIDKTDHSYPSEKENVTAPDCDTSGVKAYKCEFCGALSEEEEVAALGHKFVDENVYIVTTEATCTQTGSKYRDCYVCNTRIETEIPALGHDEGTWRVTYPSDCEQEGLKSLYCNRCDFVLDTEVIGTCTHVYGWAVTKESTCSEAGTEEYLCLICGGESSDSRTIAVLDHTAGEEVIVRESTCSVEGLAETYCVVCDAVVNSREIEKVSHIENTLTVITAPTATATGTGEYHCKACDELLRSVVIPVTEGVFYIETTPTLAGKSTTVNVYVRNNPGFSVGIVRINYDVESLIYDKVNAGDITDDITVGVPAAGEIAVLVSLDSAKYTENGLVFSLEFTLTENASNGDIELTYNPQNDFSAENGDRVFFNMEAGAITILAFVRGDCDGDGDVNTSDLAALKLYLAGADDTIGDGADIDQKGTVDTGDLAALKLHLAGVSQW